MDLQVFNFRFWTTDLNILGLTISSLINMTRMCSIIFLWSLFAKNFRIKKPSAKVKILNLINIWQFIAESHQGVWYPST